MRNDGEKITNYVMKFSYQERRKRKLESFKQELERFRNMDADELNFEYIELKTEYEHKKSVLTLFTISIALAVLMNSWGKFLSFMELALQYAAGSTDTEVMKVSFLISFPVLLFITVIILSLLFTLSNDIKKMRRKLMIIEDVTKEKKTSEENR